MEVEFRIEYRSLMDLYLSAIPSFETYSESDCPIYKIQFEQGAGMNHRYDGWSAVIVNKFLTNICK